MVFDPRLPVTQPPHVLRRPTDAPGALEPAGNAASILGFRRELAAQLQLQHSPRLPTLRATARAWAGRVTGRADRRLLMAVAEAVDALVAHCDLLTERLNSDESVNADVAAAYGAEITELRAEIIRLSRQPDRSGTEARG